MSSTFGFVLFGVILFASTFCNQVDGNQEDFCTIDEFRNCLQLLQTVDSGKKDLALPTTAEELRNTCRDLKDGVVCLDQHIQKCFSPEMQQVYINVASDAKQFVRDLCDNQTVQREFLRYATCFRNVSLDKNKCAQKYREAETIIGDLEGQDVDKLDKEAVMRRACCALREFVQCKRTHVLQWCGPRAASFMQKHLQRITNPIMDEHCRAYTFGQEACGQTLDASSSNDSWDTLRQTVVIITSQVISTLIWHLFF